MLASLLIPVFVHFCTAYSAPPAAGESLFPRPPELQPAVKFWSGVFVRWDPDQVVLFDGLDLSRVYEVRRLPPSNGTRHREREREKLREKWKRALIRDLERLAEGEVEYGRLEGRLHRLYWIWDASQDPEVYRAAAKNLRSQRGIRDKFLAGVSRSARYMDDFEQVFREEGVPVELAYLPHVESSYRWNARSKVGAVGMWQFMAYTARKYMVVSDAVDERLDPHTAARGAARYLKAAYDSLGTWPLAIISYNHGVEGIKAAVRETGTTDIVEIIKRYDGPLFGFAGRNFYSEFLAAMDMAAAILENPGELALDEPIAFDTYQLPAYVKLTTLARSLDIPTAEITALNPAIRRSAVRGDLYLTKGYNLKLPPGTSESAPVLFAAIPESERPLKAPSRIYRVRHGDNLGHIALRFKTSVRTLQRLNGIRNPNRVRAGMVLKLPH